MIKQIGIKKNIQKVCSPKSLKLKSYTAGKLNKEN